MRLEKRRHGDNKCGKHQRNFNCQGKINRLTFSSNLWCCNARGDVAGERDSVLGVDEVDEAAAQPHVLGKAQHIGQAGGGVHDDAIVHRHHGAKFALNQNLNL